jgi:hypothetical protein
MAETLITPDPIGPRPGRPSADVWLARARSHAAMPAMARACLALAYMEAGAITESQARRLTSRMGWTID